MFWPLQIAATETELAYFAGIIDGEGSILIARARYRYKNGGGPCYRVVFSLSNTNKELMDWICLKFGGKAYISKRIPGNKQSYTWMVSNKRAATIIEMVRPYLIAKQKQANLLLEFHATSHNSKGQLLPIEVQQLRQQMAERMARLNRRGTIQRLRLSAL